MNLASVNGMAPPPSPLAEPTLRGGTWRSLRGWMWFGLVLAVLVWFWLDLGITTDQIGRGLSRLGAFFRGMWPPSDGGQLDRILRSLAETFAMALTGTLFASVIAAPLGALGARTVVPNPVFHFLLRRFLDFFRAVPALIWALILVSAVGLGPLAGVLALILEDIPRFGKLYAESIENADTRQQDAVRATGAGELEVLRYGLWPQTAPIWVSQVLYVLEKNFRSAAVLGIVGAGGIGFELSERIRIFAFDEVIFITLLYMVCVAALDFLSARLRARLI